MTDIVRWGIVGCGDVTEVKSGPAFRTVPGSALVAVMRRTGALAEDYARRHGVPRWYDDAEALIRDPEVDAVYVATPPGSHLEIALAVAAAGKPAYVEKPMARSYAECAAMNEAFAAAGRPLFVAYYRRALDRFAIVRDLLASGRIGRATRVSYRYATSQKTALDAWRIDAVRSGGGLLLDLGSHALDLLDHLLGPLEDVTGTAARSSPQNGLVEDKVSMSFRTQAGIRGDASWDFSGAGPHVDEVEIAGEDGLVRFAVFGDAPVRAVARSGAEERFEAPNPRTIQTPLITSIVAALRGQGRCPSTGESAARTSRVMDRVLEGYYGGRGDAFWARPDTWPGRAVAER